MENKEFAKKLEERTKRFGITIFRFSGSLPGNVEDKTVRNQLNKARTSIGANYKKANRSGSKPDFRNKIAICESEASETSFWREIIKDMKWSESQRQDPILIESNELLTIFTSTGKNL